MEKVTIYTGWGGEYYTADYVNRLYHSCVRNMSRRFNFVLLAGPDVSGGTLDSNIKIIDTGLPYWWAGMVFWSLTGTRLFLDLDVVVVGSLDRLFDVNSECCCSRDWSTYSHIPSGHEKDANPGVSLVRGDAGAWVWDEYVKCGKPVWNPQDRSVDHTPCSMAAQGILNDDPGRVDLFSQDVCASYKYTVKKIGLPKECVTVHFHGQPKPHEVADQFVKEHWR